MQRGEQHISNRLTSTLLLEPEDRSLDEDRICPGDKYQCYDMIVYIEIRLKPI